MGLLASAPDAFAEAVTLTDIAGREVTLPEMPDKIILGEGRMMYAVAPLTDGNVINVFEPAILHVASGDSVTFIPTDSGHNAASKRGMIPDRAAPWNGAVDEELTVTLTVPGIYSYLCLPHYEVGMIGLIVVGEDLSNLHAVKKARHPGDARKAFRGLLAELETQP